MHHKVIDIRSEPQPQGSVQILIIQGIGRVPIRITELQQGRKPGVWRGVYHRAVGGGNFIPKRVVLHGVGTKSPILYIV